MAAETKIHLPGEMRDGIQRCTRCHTILHDSAKYGASRGWQSPVASSRYGMSVDIPDNARDCGRRPVAAEA